MPTVPQKTLDTAISAIEDPEIRESIAKAVSGNYEFEVHCLSKKCKGKLLGYLGPELSHGIVGKREKKSVNGGIARLRPKRFDKAIGLVCGFCGQNSLRSDEEKGIVGAELPSDNEFLTIAKRLKNKKAYQETNGVLEVDGFRFVRI